MVNEYGKAVEKRIVINDNTKRYKEKINLVFTKENGLYVGTDLTRYPFKIIHNELGIKKCRFYDLRGSYATKILTNGIEIRDVADILGHRNVETANKNLLKSGRKNISFKVMDNLKMDTPDNYFDLVTARHTIIEPVQIYKTLKKVGNLL